MTDEDKKLKLVNVAVQTSDCPGDSSQSPTSEKSSLEEELQSRTRLLTERIKELNCLYSVSKLADRRSLRFDEFLQKTVETIPGAWQYPEIACARITLEGERYQSENFAETIWKQETPIVMYGDPIGLLEVYYREERPECDEGPFLREERSLINSIAQRVGEISERKSADRQLLRYKEQLQILTEELVRAEERERRRIADNLHDRVGQTLATIKIKLSVLLGEGTPGASQEKLKGLRELVEQAITDTRFLIYDLSPPILYEFGLKAALEWLREQTQKLHPLVVKVGERGESRPISDEANAMLFRSTQELLANIVKHANARTAQISLSWKTDSVTISIEDDGDGFEFDEIRPRAVQLGAFGLFSIQERLEHFGGRLRIDSQLGHGTRAHLMVPLSWAEEARKERT